jgi:hypothetical protein
MEAANATLGSDYSDYVTPSRDTTSRNAPSRTSGSGSGGGLGALLSYLNPFSYFSRDTSTAPRETVVSPTESVEGTAAAHDPARGPILTTPHGVAYKQGDSLTTGKHKEAIEASVGIKAVVKPQNGPVEELSLGATTTVALGGALANGGRVEQAIRDAAKSVRLEVSTGITAGAKFETFSAETELANGARLVMIVTPSVAATTKVGADVNLATKNASASVGATLALKGNVSIKVYEKGGDTPREIHATVSLSAGPTASVGIGGNAATPKLSFYDVSLENASLSDLPRIGAVLKGAYEVTAAEEEAREGIDRQYRDLENNPHLTAEDKERIRLNWSEQFVHGRQK